MSEAAGEIARAVDPAPFVRRSKDGTRSLELAVTGAHCAGCLRKIETGVARLDGVSAARLNLTTGHMRVEWRGELPAASITEALIRLGYACAPFDPQAATAETDREGRRLLACLAVAGFAAGNVMLFSVGLWTASGADMGSATRSFLHWASGLIALPAAAHAGRPFFFSAWRALRVGHANMDVPISLAVLLSLAMSLYETTVGAHYAYFDAAVSLLFLLLIGRYLDHRLRYRAGAAARDLVALQSLSARRIDADGHVVSVAARDLSIGDRLLIAPGERVPVNCTIWDGASEFDLSLLTGESAPVTLKDGDAIPGGARNLSSRIVAKATARVQDSLAAELARLIDAGKQSRARFVRLADKAAALYVPIVHSLAAATFVGWWLLSGGGFAASLMNAIAVLIITCPCALGLAVPAVQIVATGRLFRQGILVKSGDGLERIAEIDTVVFDKTGTLTRGRPRLAPGQDATAAQIETAARLARVSTHPFARAIAEAAGPGPVANHGEEIPGAGIRGTIDGKAARLGHKSFVTGEEDHGGMELWFSLEGETPLRITFEDELRADAAATAEALKKRGLDLILLSGDGEAPTRAVAETLGISNWRAHQKPADKLALLKELQAAGKRVLMIGDGLNDAPSLAGAHVSMSPGSAADASQAAADFVFQGERLAPITLTVDVARRARLRIFENFAFTVVYNVGAVPLAIAGLVTPFIAAIAMSASSLVVTLNALRLAGKAQRSR